MTNINNVLCKKVQVVVNDDCGSPFQPKKKHAWLNLLKKSTVSHSWPPSITCCVCVPCSSMFVVLTFLVEHISLSLSLKRRPKTKRRETNKVSKNTVHGGMCRNAGFVPGL